MRAVYKYQIWLDCFWYLLKLKLCWDNVSYLVRYYGRSNRGFQFLSMCKVWYSHMQWQFKGSALFLLKKQLFIKIVSDCTICCKNILLKDAHFMVASIIKL